MYKLKTMQSNKIANNKYIQFKMIRNTFLAALWLKSSGRRFCNIDALSFLTYKFKKLFYSYPYVK